MNTSTLFVRKMVGFAAVAVFLACLASSSLVEAADLSNSQTFTYDDGSGNTLLYRLFFPPGYDTPGADFPLVLFLHGAGEIGTDNLAPVVRHIDGLIEATQSSEHAAFLLAPQIQPGQGEWSRLGHPTTLATAMDLTLQVIDQLEQTYAIDPTRRSVTGLSLGGFGTWDVIAKRPEMFASAVPMSGGGDPDQAENLTKTPIWNFHGRRDTTINVRSSRNVIGAIERAGGDPIYLESFGRHNIWGPIYDDPYDELYPWLFDGVAPPLATAIYNPATGNLKIDTSKAPGGETNDFSLITNLSFDLQPTMVVDGVIVNTDDFVTLIIESTSQTIQFDPTFSSTFGGVADFGEVMPTGLTSEEIHNRMVNLYNSPVTEDSLRNMRIIMEVPEPQAVVLLGFVMTILAVFNRPGAKYFCH